jgi:hypothetical protein
VALDIIFFCNLYLVLCFRPELPNLQVSYVNNRQRAIYSFYTLPMLLFPDAVTELLALQFITLLIGQRKRGKILDFSLLTLHISAERNIAPKVNNIVRWLHIALILLTLRCSHCFTYCSRNSLLIVQHCQIQN